MADWPGRSTLISMTTNAPPPAKQTARSGRPTIGPVARLVLAYVAALLLLIGATASGDTSGGDPFAHPDAPIAGF
jgi:hypothetical protein